MNTLFIGQNSSGKTTNMKEFIKNIESKVIVLDFSDEYEDFTENELFLDDINPLLSSLSLLDVKALNAGYLADSHCLYRKSEEVLRELHYVDPSLKGKNINDLLPSLHKIGLVEESIERLQISWDNTETMYGKILNKKIPTKKYKKHFPLEYAINIIQNSDRIRLRSKSMHSDHLRAVAFILLSKLSRETTEPIYIVGDELSSFFNNGNSNLFSQTIESEKLNFVLSFNKAMNIPKKMFPSFDTYFVHRFESNSEIKDLNKYGIELNADVKKINRGEYIEIKAVKEFTGVL